MNIFITGAQGYIGRATVRRLLEEGHTVIEICRGAKLPDENLRHLFVLGELYDVPRLLTIFKEYKVERIIHLAAQSSPWVSLDVPLQTIEANISLTVSLLEAARLSGIKRVVLFSSECAYGEHGNDVCTIDTALIPRTPYAVTKAANEMLGRVYNWKFTMNCVSLRIARVYGGKQLTPNCVKSAIEAGLKGEKYILPSGADQMVNLIHVDDAAEITLAACFTERINDMAVYNAVSHGAPFRIILAIIEELIPGFKYEVGPGIEPGGENQGEWDMSESERDLGFIPKYTLREGLEHYIEFLKNKK